LFEAHGEIDPQWFVEIKGRLQLMPQPPAPFDMPGPFYKEAIFEQVRHFFRERNVTRYVYLNEAWTVEGEKGSAAPVGSLANHPERREVVGITAEDQNETLMVTREIVRPADGTPFLRPLGEITRPDTVEGRQFGLLPRSAKTGD
jgi:hypothetical protein